MRPVDHLRAVFVAFHLGAVLLMGLPAPNATDVEQISTPRRQAALAPWREALAAVGYRLSADEFTARARAIGEAWVSAEHAVVRGFRPYVRCCGTAQSWKMFGTFEHAPGRLDIAVREQGVWRTVYAGSASDRRWRARQLEQERFRGLQGGYGERQKRTSWPSFVGWVAARAAEDFPNVDRVRVQMVRTLPDDPRLVVRTGAVPDGKPYWTEELAVERP